MDRGETRHPLHGQILLAAEAQQVEQCGQEYNLEAIRKNMNGWELEQ